VEKATALVPIVESVEPGEPKTGVVGQVDPGQFRPLMRRIKEEIGDDVAIEILEVNVTSAKEQPSEAPAADDKSGDEGSDDQEDGEEP
jgi:hypothetical protein